MDGMERKNLRVEIKDAEKGVVYAAFAKLDAKDRDDDWTPSGAFGDQKVRVSAYGHGSWAGELPVGKGAIKEIDGEAVAELKFFMSTARGREHFEVIKEMGDLQEWSYGYDVLEMGELTDELRDKGVQRVLKRVKVHEVSPVLLGAGVGTRTLAVKALEDLLGIGQGSPFLMENNTVTTGETTVVEGIKITEPDTKADQAEESEEVKESDETETAEEATEIEAATEGATREAEAKRTENRATAREEFERFTLNMRKSGRK